MFYRYEIVVTHDRGDWRTTGPRRKVREFTLTNTTSEAEARAELERCTADFPRYRLKLVGRTTDNKVVDL